MRDRQWQGHGCPEIQWLRGRAIKRPPYFMKHDTCFLCDHVLSAEGLKNETLEKSEKEYGDRFGENIGVRGKLFGKPFAEAVHSKCWDKNTI